MIFSGRNIGIGIVVAGIINAILAFTVFDDPLYHQISAITILIGAVIINSTIEKISKADEEGN